MANTPQAKKRIRRNARRAEINRARVSRIRTFVKQVEAALEAGDKDAGPAAITRVQPDSPAESPTACSTRTPRPANSRA